MRELDEDRERFMTRLVDLLLIDNNAIWKLDHAPSRRRLIGNLRATGREFWPTGMNVMEAVKSRREDVRTRLLATLAELSGDAHAFPLPTEALKRVAEAHLSGTRTITWAEPRFTNLIRNPTDATDDQIGAVRDYLLEQEQSFDATHEEAREELLPELKNMGGRERWPNVGSFLDEVWNPPGHLGSYVEGIWSLWGFPGQAPVQDLLADRAWKLFFEGWGAAVYARLIAHPQPPKVEYADLVQMVYCGSARSTLFVSDDKGFRELANAVFRGRHHRMEVVPLSAVTT